MITIVDSGGANLSSIMFSLGRLGVTSRISNDPEVIKESSHVILPGVGSAEVAMKRLKKHGLITLIKSLQQPVLGICLGMQLLFDFSEEGNVECLGLIPGTIKKISSNLQASKRKLIVPHMGWNIVEVIKQDSIMKNISNKSYLYFVHSYIAPLCDYTTGMTNYGISFSSAVQHKNFYGTQFHPERSSQVGEKILQNFVEM